MTDGIGLLRELLAPLTDPAQRVFWPFLFSTVVIALVVGAVTGRGALRTAWDGLLSPSLWLHRSSRLDLKLALLRGLVRVGGLVPWTLGAWGLAVAVTRSLDGVLGRPELAAPPVLLMAVYSALLFLAWDASRYLLHRLLHEVPALWELHQVHHSAEVLTPATFYRAHPVEAFLFALRGVLVTGVLAGLFFWAFRGQASQAQLLGVGALGFLFNALGGNLRHSHVWLSYGRRVEGWLLSPAQHQIHHTAAGSQRNYGSWLAIWDRLGGSLERAGARRELVFGLPEGERNHAPDDLIGALLGPLAGLGRHVSPAPIGLAVLIGVLALPVVSRADESEDEPATESEDEPEDEDETGDEDGANTVGDTVTIVDTRGGLPRVAGSAHVVDEEELERFEHDDIHRVLAPVPGVYVRDEDGYGLRPNIGLRGASSDRSAKVTLLEDGVLLAPAPYSAPAAYYFPTTTRMVGVEVFKGPAATRHGPHTIGGAINMQTREIPTRPDGALDVGVGMRRTFKLHGHAGAGARWWGVLLEGVHLSTDGFKQLDDGGETGFDKSEVMLKARISTKPGAPIVSEWQLKGGYANELSRETYLGLTDGDFEETPTRRYAASGEGLMRWHRTQAELRWRLRVHDAFDVDAVVYHHWMDRSWRKLNGFAGGPDMHSLLLRPDGGQAAVFAAILRGEEDSATDDQTLMIGTNARSFHAAGGQVTARLRGAWRKVSSELEIGVRLHGDRIHREHSEDPFRMVSGRLVPEGGETVETTENVGSAFAFSAHVHEDLGIGPLRLLPGVRVEVVSTSFDDRLDDAQTEATRAVVLPGIGLHVQPTPWLSVLGGVHRGYSPVAPGQPADTKPEQSWNLEAGARFFHRGTRVELIGFFNDYVNLTGQCTFSGGCSDDQLDQQFNAGRVHVYGLEALAAQEIVLPAGLGLRGQISYTFTGSSFRSAFVSGFPQFGAVAVGDELPYVPEHQGAASITFLHPRGSVEVAAKAQSAMRDVAGQGAIHELEKLPAYVVLDLAADVQITKHVLVYGTVNNLTNAKYAVSRRPFGLRPGRPIHVMLGVKLKGFPEIKQRKVADPEAWTEG